jgi:hypothetical protein
MRASASAARAAATLLASCASLVGGPARATAAEGASYAWTRVNYVTASAIYIDAGRSAGLHEGDRADVVRADSVVARLDVVAVSSLHAMCERASGDGSSEATLDIRIGDRVRFVPRAPVPTSSSDSAAAPHSRRDDGEPALERLADRDSSRDRGPDASLRALGLRGRFGVRLLAVFDRTTRDRTFYEPGLDLRLTGDDVASTPFGFAIDVRARRSYRREGDGGRSSAGRARVYRLASTWRRADSGLRITAGRQLSPSLAPVSVFDGLLAEYLGERWQAGAFGGTQPNAASFAYSNDIREHGGYAQWDPSPRGALRSSFTLGFIGSYQESQANREFAFLQCRASNRRTSAYLAQEIDLNRSWKAAAEEKRILLTSTFANLRHRVAGGLTLSAGYDNRRNARLYRDRVTPETDFDDSYRQGLWGGLDMEHAGRFRVGARAQNSRGGASGDAASYTLSASANRLSILSLRAGLRGTRYESDQLAGWLGSLRIGAPIANRVDLELDAGVRDEMRSGLASGARTISWLGGSIEASITSSLFGALSYERSEGVDEEIDQLLTSLGYRL